MDISCVEWWIGVLGVIELWQKVVMGLVVLVAVLDNEGK